MKENPNIILTFLTEGITRIKINDPSNYNALSSKNINSLINIFTNYETQLKSSDLPRRKLELLYGMLTSFSDREVKNELDKDMQNCNIDVLSVNYKSINDLVGLAHRSV